MMESGDVIFNGPLPWNIRIFQRILALIKIYLADKFRILLEYVMIYSPYKKSLYIIENIRKPLQFLGNCEL